MSSISLPQIRRIALRVERPVHASDDGALQFAIAIAARAGGQLEVLAYETDVLSPEHDGLDRSLEAARFRVESLAARSGVGANVQDRPTQAEGIGESFASLLQLCDLGVLGVPQQPWPAIRMITATAVFQGGPTLLVPEGMAPVGAPSRVTVAWKPGPASARALKAAVALAGSDGELIVLQVEEPGSSRADRSGLDATRYAAAHGVNARFEPVPASSHSPFAALAAVTRELEADVLACGAVRHGPIHLALFGSVTKEALSAGFSQPVLLAG